MAKKFNTTGLCLPDRHYMVDTSKKVESIIQLVNEGDYFVINRARQYGKTTTLHLLAEKLKSQYTVFSLSFEGIGENAFESEYSFCRTLLHLMDRETRYGKTIGLSESVIGEMRQLGEKEQIDFLSLTDFFLDLCDKSKMPVVLIIDEVDQASNARTFIDFLGVLRNNYLQRGQMPAFQSVILAGIYDIKNLKLKIRPDEEHQYNSPWNIAADFNVDMSFSAEEIAQMLLEYESEHHTEMNIAEISKLIFDYTLGYPYMVSRICKIMDEGIGVKNEAEHADCIWSKEGFLIAVKCLLREQNLLFDDMQKKLADFPELKKLIYEILFHGTKYSFETNNTAVELGSRFGFLKDQNGSVVISNRIFETKLYNIFLSEEETKSVMYKAGALDKNQFIVNGKLCMDFVMEKFCEHFTEIYGDTDQKFVEDNGRRIFLMYMKPIINGTGNYYVESRTRDLKRTDVIIDYHGVQEIVELKIWHGKEYNSRGEQQLFEYLDYYKKEKGYLLSFNFNKEKKIGIHKIEYHGKTIVEVVC